MSPDFFFSIVGLIFGFIGSLILAVSLNSLLGQIVKAILFMDLTQEGMLHPTAPIVKARDIDESLKKGGKSAKNRTVVGLILLVVSFAFQIVALMVKS